MSLTSQIISPKVRQRINFDNISLVATVIGLAIVYKSLLIAMEMAASNKGYLGLISTIIALLVAGYLAISNISLKYDRVWLPLSILMRGSSSLILIQMLVDAFWPTSFQSNIFFGIDAEIKLILLVGMIAGVISLVRPAFVLPMLIAYSLFRARIPILFELPSSKTDFVTLVDVGQFPAFILNVYWRLRQDGPHYLKTYNIKDFPSLKLEKLLWAVAVGIHVGNYFRSGIAKVRAGGPDPFFWLLHNPIDQSAAIGLYRFTNPLAGWPSAVQGLDYLLLTVAIVLNASVITLQLLSPAAVLTRRTFILITLFFDAMHIAIYFSLGAFFFLWIGLNVIILLSLANMKDYEYSKTLRFTVLFCGVFGSLIFTTAGLGWLDGKKIVRETFFATLTDGRQVLVPPSFFGIYSYQIGHGDLYVPPDHFPVRFGTNVTHRDWIDGSTCGPLIVDKEQAFTSLSSIVDLVKTTHQFFKNHETMKELNLYYYYLHHMPSNPTFFTAFNDAKMSDIKSYSYVVESSCVEMQNGKLKADVHKRSEFPIAVE
jgi:hypothetical protein